MLFQFRIGVDGVRSFTFVSEGSREICGYDSVIAIARSLDLTVVAEGVEDEPTAAALADAGADLLQGYHLARPQPADQLESKFMQSSGGLTGPGVPVAFYGEGERTGSK